MTPSKALVLLLVTTTATAAQASIIRWDNSAVIPGTQSITLAPHIDLTGKNLAFALLNTDLTGAIFQKTNLHNAEFAAGAIVTGADFSKATITGTHFDNLSASGFTFAQLSSTASFASHNLTGITVINDNLTNWDCSRQNLTSADLSGANLTNVVFTNAVIAKATFDANAGFTFAQLASTKSYAKKSLQHITFIDTTLANAFLIKQNLSNSTLQNSDFISANLTSANLANAAVSSDLTGALLIKANLNKATFHDATLTGANLSGATIAGANFDGSTLTLAQLATTANYTKHNLSNINLSDLDLTGANFTKVTLTKATFNDTILANSNLTKAVVANTNFTDADLAGSLFAKIKLTNTNFSEADLRSATGFLPVKTTNTTNAILPDGTIHGLALTANEKLTIHNNALPVTVNTGATFHPGSTLEFLLTNTWTSPINFAPSVTPSLAGTLDLEFPTSLPAITFAGHSYQLFDWNTPPVSPNQFTNITTDRRLVFDLSHLYTTGLISVSLPSGSPNNPTPEPTSLALLTPTLLLLKPRRRPQ